MVEFADRADAGRLLAERLEYLRGQDVVVLGLPRGGVPVAFEVAQALDAPLDVIVVRKLGTPIQPELAMGAIGEGGVRVLNDEVLDQTYVTEEQLRTLAAPARRRSAQGPRARQPDQSDRGDRRRRNSDRVHCARGMRGRSRTRRGEGGRGGSRRSVQDPAELARGRRSRVRCGAPTVLLGREPLSRFLTDQ